MPYIVGGKQFYHARLAGLPDFDFEVQTPVTANGSGRDYGAAIQDAEQNLAQEAGDADAIVDIVYAFRKKSDTEIVCTAMGIPIKRLHAA